MRLPPTLILAALASLGVVSCYGPMGDQAAGGGDAEGGEGGGGGAGGSGSATPARKATAAPVKTTVLRATMPSPGAPIAVARSLPVSLPLPLPLHEDGPGILRLDVAPEKPSASRVRIPPSVAPPATARPDPVLDVRAKVETTLSNNEGVCPHAWIAPLAGEESQLAVARVTPPSYPFELTRIRYALDNGGLKEGRVTCSAAWDHDVQIFASDTVRPPARPQILERWMVPGVSSTDPIVTHELRVTHPITLAKGQHLFIAVRAAGRAPNSLCMAVCGGPAVAQDRNYWSKDGPPYSWPKLASFNLDYSFRFDAVGFSR